MRNTYTYTYAILEISQAAYNEIAAKIRAAGGYEEAFHDHDGRECIDMHGIALAVEVSKTDPAPPPEGASDEAGGEHG